MALPIITNQLGTLVANAGLTQNVSISTTTGGALDAGSGSASQAQTGLGWATLQNTPNGTPIGTTAAAIQTNWPFYLVIAALAYFAWEMLR